MHYLVKWQIPCLMKRGMLFYEVVNSDNRGAMSYTREYKKWILKKMMSLN